MSLASDKRSYITPKGELVVDLNEINRRGEIKFNRMLINEGYVYKKDFWIDMETFVLNVSNETIIEDAYLYTLIEPYLLESEPAELSSDYFND